MWKVPGILYRNKFHVPPLPPPSSLANQTILITGANTGLGLATALHCLNLGASTVIITARDAAKGEAAKSYLETSTTNKSGTVKVMQLNMSTFADVKDFADRVKKEVPVIDTVYLNAGVQNLKGADVVSPEGWEITLQVNLLSTALLGILLLPWMKVAGGGKAKLGITGSGLHRAVEITPESGWPQHDIFKFWKNRENVQAAGGQKMMSISKLLLQYVVRELAKLALGADGRPEVVVTSYCPGLVKTELGRDLMTNRVFAVAGNAVMTAVFKSTEGGARTLVYAAVAPPEDNGKYFTHYQSDEEYRSVTEKNIFGPDGIKMQQQVWGELVALLAEKVPEVKQIVSQP